MTKNWIVEKKKEEGEGAGEARNIRTSRQVNTCWNADVQGRRRAGGIRANTCVNEESLVVAKMLRDGLYKRYKLEIQSFQTKKPENEKISLFSDDGG